MVATSSPTFHSSKLKHFLLRNLTHELSVLYGSSSPSIALTQSSCQSEVCPKVFLKASLSCASTQPSGVDPCPRTFVKQTSGNAFLGLERYLTLPWAPKECGSLHVVQQWSTSKADMVNYFCKALKTEGEWVLGFAARAWKHFRGWCEKWLTDSQCPSASISHMNGIVQQRLTDDHRINHK